MIVIAKKIRKNYNKTEIYRYIFIKALFYAIKMKCKGYSIELLRDKDV